MKIITALQIYLFQAGKFYMAKPVTFLLKNSQRSANYMGKIKRERSGEEKQACQKEEPSFTVNSTSPGCKSTTSLWAIWAH